MIESLKKGTINDVLFGVTLPTCVALLIVAIGIFSVPSLEGIKYPLLEAIVIIGVPMLLGLIWNQWAGGASGFLLGGLYALYYSDQLYAVQGSLDVSLLSNLVSAMLMGYVAGALSKRSLNIRRLIIAGVTSGIMGAIIIVVFTPFSTILGGTTLSGVLLTFLPRVLAGLIVPFLARSFLRRGALQKEDYMNKMEQAGFRVNIVGEDKDISNSQYKGINLESIKIEATK